MSRRLPLLALALVFLAFAFSGCGGGSKPQTITRGESEAEYVTLGNMQYQVQLSRQLNRYEAGDRALLGSIEPGQETLKPDELWFGVWIRIFNKSDKVHQGADQFTIVDTKGTEYGPIPQGDANPFAYRSQPVKDNGQYPTQGSAPANSPTTGAFLLFKLPRQALDFRPLELEFSSSLLPGQVSSIRIDV